MNIFENVQVRKPGSSVFNLSHDHKLSLDAGRLYPMLAMEIAPGDKVSLSSSQLVRMMPSLAPMMQRVQVSTHYFFVPNRIVWDGWETFITGSRKGKVLPPEDIPAFPYLNFTEGIGDQSLAQYMGVPMPSSPGGEVNGVSAIPFAAAAKIWNEYYRDQNLQAEIPCDLVDGNNTLANVELYQFAHQRPPRKAYEHDYFTSALPFAQKGDAVTIPLGTEAPLIFSGPDEDAPDKYYTEDGQPIPNAAAHFADSGHPDGYGFLEPFGATGEGTNVDVSPTHKVDLTSATASTITDLRRAFKLQEWLERNALAGTRYNEHIWAMFGVRTSDARLQRPEYLGGGKSDVFMSEVAQTSGTPDDGGTPQGTLAGHGINAGSSHTFNRFFEEHGYIIGFIFITPKTSYFQGLPKHFMKFDRFDYMQPLFAHIGDQAIINKELYIDDDEEINKEVFGYIPRYSEYRYLPSRISGTMQTSMRFWSWPRVFNNVPQLTSEFIECNPGKEPFAVTDDSVDSWVAHVYFNIRAVRKLPKYGTPMM